MNTPVTQGPLDLTEQHKVLHEIMEDANYHAHPLTPEEVGAHSLSIMSRYARFLKGLSATAEAAQDVGEYLDDAHHSHHSDVSHDFHALGIVFATINFFRIPYMYLSAYLLKQPVPITLSNNARWAYASLLLGFAIGSLFTPIVTLVGAAVVFSANIFFLGKLLYERGSLKRELKFLEREITRQEEVMDTIQDEAKKIQERLKKATEESQVNDISLELALLKERHREQTKILHELYSQKLQKQQLKDSLSDKKIIFRSISIVLAAAMLAGAIIALFIPPVGLGIMAGVAIASATYILGRFFGPKIQSLWRGHTEKPEAELQENRDEQVHLEESDSHDKDNVLEMNKGKHDISLVESVHESTADVLVRITSTEERSHLSEHRAADTDSITEEADPIFSTAVSSVEGGVDVADKDEVLDEELRENP